VLTMDIAPARPCPSYGAARLAHPVCTPQIERNAWVVMRETFACNRPIWPRPIVEVLDREHRLYRGVQAGKTRRTDGSSYKRHGER